MPDGDFQPGTWSKLPSNCTRSFTITYVRCAEWAYLAIKECATWAIQAAITCISWAWESVESCLSWVWQTVNECVSWGSSTSTECCDWWPCSWLCDIVIVITTFFCILFAAVTTAVCVLWGVVVTLACVAFAIVVSLVCIAVAIVWMAVCLLWVPVSIIFCLSTASGGTAFLLTDGTVMMQECKTIFSGTFATNRWWRLTPDQSGSYAGGSWSQLANSALGRRYFASSVLADGRVLVCGGEYTDATGIPTEDDDNTGEIYDPVANSWSAVSPPLTAQGTDWVNVGDGSSTVLPDGTFLLGSIDDDKIDTLNPATLKWTPMKPRPTVPSSDEDSWVLMPDNTVVGPSCSDDGSTWVYNIGADHWEQGNSLPENLIDAASEIGPGLLLYDGTAFFLGSNQHTAIYTPGGKPAWVNGPDLPQESGKDLGIVDGPAALLVTGNVLFGAGPIDAKGDFLTPDYFFEFDGTAFHRTADPPNHDCMTYQSRLLLLPDATVFFCREDDDSFYAYTPASNTPDDRLRPVIQACPAQIAAGSTIQVSGTQFNGLSQAVAYGDDCQTPTNYPLVRVTNAKTGHVRYCRTFDHTTVGADGSTVPAMGVATGSAVITTSVAIPGNLEHGESHLEIVANGIASGPFQVTITAAVSS